MLQRYDCSNVLADDDGRRTTTDDGDCRPLICLGASSSDNLDATQNISSSTNIGTKIFTVTASDNAPFPLSMDNSSYFQLTGSWKKDDVHTTKCLQAGDRHNLTIRSKNQATCGTKFLTVIVDGTRPQFNVPVTTDINVTSSDVAANQVLVYYLQITNSGTCTSFGCDVTSSNSAHAFQVVAGSTNITTTVDGLAYNFLYQVAVTCYDTHAKNQTSVTKTFNVTFTSSVTVTTRTTRASTTVTTTMETTTRTITPSVISTTSTRTAVPTTKIATQTMTASTPTTTTMVLNTTTATPIKTTTHIPSTMAATIITEPTTKPTTLETPMMTITISSESISTPTMTSTIPTTTISTPTMRTTQSTTTYTIPVMTTTTSPMTTITLNLPTTTATTEISTPTMSTMTPTRTATIPTMTTTTLTMSTTRPSTTYAIPMMTTTTHPTTSTKASTTTTIGTTTVSTPTIPTLTQTTTTTKPVMANTTPPMTTTTSNMIPTTPTTTTTANETNKQTTILTTSTLSTTEKNNVSDLLDIPNASSASDASHDDEEKSFNTKVIAAVSALGGVALVGTLGALLYRQAGSLCRAPSAGLGRKRDVEDENDEKGERRASPHPRWTRLVESSTLNSGSNSPAFERADSPISVSSRAGLISSPVLGSRTQNNMTPVEIGEASVV